MRPLDRLNSIKVKLGVVIIAAVIVTVASIVLAHKVGIRPRFTILLAALFALSVILFLAHGMTAPLREMAAAAREMERGKYGRRVRATSRDEVGELAHAFNRMATELEQVDVMRRDLIANVSHELKTPISGLRAMLENAVDGVAAVDTETLQVMLSQVNRLGDLIEDLLDLSRLESRAVEIERESFQLHELVDRVVEEATFSFQSQSNGKVVRIDSMVPKRLELVGDIKRLHQVLFNLVDNAVRHSPDGSAVELSAAATSDVVTVTVDDQGPGIAEEEAGLVFERFYGSNRGKNVDGSSGLGLAIARWIVELHGGSIAASSNASGGCRMTVAIPRTGSDRGGMHGE